MREKQILIFNPVPKKRKSKVKIKKPNPEVYVEDIQNLLLKIRNIYNELESKGKNLKQEDKDKIHFLLDRVLYKIGSQHGKKEN